MNLSKSLLLLIALLIGAYFVHHYVKTNEWLEHGSLIQTQIPYNRLQKDDFIIYTKESKVQSYLKVVGLAEDNTPIVQYGHKTAALQSLIGNDINNLNADYDAARRYKPQFLNEEDYWTSTLYPLTEEQYNKLRSSYFMDSYSFQEIYRNLRNSLWSRLNYSLAGYPAIVFILILVVLLIRVINRWINSFIPSKVHDVLVFLILVRLVSFLLLGMNAKAPEVMSSIGHILIPFLLCLPFFFLYKWLWPKTATLSFGVRQALLFVLIVLTSSLLLLGYIYFIITAVGDKLPAVPAKLSDAIYMYFRNPIPFYIGSAVFFANTIEEYIRLKRLSTKAAASVQQATVATSELESIQARVNPHFLYNALNSIASLATVAPEKTQEMAIALSKFYRFTTNRKDVSNHTLGEELELIRSYLTVEQVRFGDKLSFTIDVAEDMHAASIPRFLLQPLVENSVKYGYDPEKDSIDIELSIVRKENHLTISVYDSGPPFDEAMELGYGLSSIQKKLKLAYGPEAELVFVREPRKCVQLQIPSTHA